MWWRDLVLSQLDWKFPRQIINHNMDRLIKTSSMVTALNRNINDEIHYEILISAHTRSSHEVEECKARFSEIRSPPKPLTLLERVQATSNRVPTTS